MHTLTGHMHGSPGPVLHNAGPWAALVGRDFPLHVHDHHWELHYYRRGAIVAEIGGRRIPVHPGVLTAVPPGVWHGERAQSDYANYWVQIEAPADLPWPVVGIDDEHASIGQIVRAIVTEHKERPTGHAEMIGLLLAQLDIRLRRGDHRSTLTRSEQIVRAAEWTMTERISQPVTIAAVADRAGVSTSRLRSAFAECRGRSPLAVFHTIRAGYAARLIQGTTAPLEAIAHSCGYDSASHLSRHIRRENGVPPGQLRADAIRRSGPRRAPPNLIHDPIAPGPPRR